jgi:histidine ammonia-lyase
MVSVRAALASRSSAAPITCGWQRKLYGSCTLPQRAWLATMALCEVGSISERRTAVLIDPKMSGLPPFLVENSGLNSGLMIPQVTAAALVSENKCLAFPASVDSIPTSAGQEDHVSMAPIAARKAGTIARNAAGVVAVELIAAAQGVDFHAPLKTSAKLQQVHSSVRGLSPGFTSDRYWADDMAALQSAVLAGEIGAGEDFLD